MASDECSYTFTWEIVVSDLFRRKLWCIGGAKPTVLKVSVYLIDCRFCLIILKRIIFLFIFFQIVIVEKLIRNRLWTC